MIHQLISGIPLLIGLVLLVIFCRLELARKPAKRDLREVYPPKRDRFHRDLERLNKLRGDVATKPAYTPLPGDSYVQMPEAVMEALRKERESELRERAANRSIRDKKIKKWLSSDNPATPNDYAISIVFIVVLTALGLWMASQL